MRTISMASSPSSAPVHPPPSLFRAGPPSSGALLATAPVSNGKSRQVYAAYSVFRELGWDEDYTIFFAFPF